MHWRFEQSESPEFIRIVASGDFSSTQFAEMFDELFSLEYWRFGIPLLCDNRELDLASAGMAEHLAACDHFVGMNNLASTPMAVVLETPESLKIGKRVMEMTEDQSPADVRIFRSEDEAIEWIASGCPID